MNSSLRVKLAIVAALCFLPLSVLQAEEYCNGTPYDPNTQGCCAGTIYDLSTQGCCSGFLYDLSTQECCS
ncbi:MAG: hypothetical protein WCV00_23630, partial [Verrucomicrobiia bacterium]